LGLSPWGEGLTERGKYAFRGGTAETYFVLTGNKGTEEKQRCVINEGKKRREEKG